MQLGASPWYFEHRSTSSWPKCTASRTLEESASPTRGLFFYVLCLTPFWRVAWRPPANPNQYKAQTCNIEPFWTKDTSDQWWIGKWILALRLATDISCRCWAIRSPGDGGIRSPNWIPAKSSGRRCNCTTVRMIDLELITDFLAHFSRIHLQAIWYACNYGWTARLHVTLGYQAMASLRALRIFFFSNVVAPMWTNNVLDRNAVSAYIILVRDKYASVTLPQTVFGANITILMYVWTLHCYCVSCWFEGIG